MDEINFCPFCDAPQHKLMLLRENNLFCKECSRFFSLEELDIRCSRCKGKLRKSDFPSPKGDPLFMCSKCKRTFPFSEVME